MKKINKFVAIVMSACMVCAVPTVLSGCNNNDDGTHQEQNAAVKVKDGIDISVKVGESKTVTVSEYVTANGETVSVQSSNPDVVTATLSNGIVTVLGKAKGTANVKIICGSVTVTFPVSVTAEEKTPAPVFEDLTASFVINEDDEIEVTLAPKSGGEGFTVVYELATIMTGVQITGNKLTFTTETATDAEISVIAKCTDTANPQTAYDDITFKVKISVSVNTTVYYTVIIDGEAQQVAHGDTVKLPNAPKQPLEADKQFNGWDVDGETKSGGSTITVTKDLVITAVIGDAPQTEPDKVKDGGAISFLLSVGSATVSVEEYITTNGHAVYVASSEEDVANVSESNGTVTITAVAAGKTDVTLTCKDIVITFNVTVINAVPTFENGTINIDLYENTTGTYTITPNGAQTFSYQYSVNGATVSDGVLSYTAKQTGTFNLTVNVTATDSATDEEETTSFTVTVNVTDTSAYRVTNGDFEDDLTGWELSNAALGSVNDDGTYWAEAIPFNNDGNFFNALATGAEESATGTLKSSNFKVSKSGWITYKLGGARNIDSVTLEIVSATDETKRAVLPNFDWSDVAGNTQVRGCTLVSYKANLHEYGFDEDESVYLLVTDNGTGDYGLFFLDSVETYYTQEPAGSFNLVSPTRLYNGNFEIGNLSGWTLVDGEMFGAVSSDDMYFTGDVYGKDGNYLFTGAAAGDKGTNGEWEAKTGVLRSSSVLIKAGSTVSFKLGGGNNENLGIRIVKKDGGEVIASYNNININSAEGVLVQYSYQLTEITEDTECYIEIFDNLDKTVGWGLVTVDSITITH